MTNQRWEVFCYRYENGDHDWVATGDKHWHRFSTWREALDYADRKARTVEATLPRNSTKAGRFAITTQPRPMRHITEIASTKTNTPRRKNRARTPSPRAVRSTHG